MSFQIKDSDFTVIKSSSDWQPRPAMKEAMGHLCSVFSEAYPHAETGDTWVSFDNAVGRTTIFATPIDIKTPDGYHLLDRLVVKTVLPEGVWELSDSLIVEANTMATMGALMVDPNTGELVIVSSATFLDCNGGDDGLESIYVPFVSSAAVFHHPNLGNGLFFKLELPDAYSKEQLVELVHHLNQLEVTGADVPPFFGAWCSHIKTRRIAYVGFLPNLAYWPGSVSHISGWLKLRAQTARATIGNFIFREDHPQQKGASMVMSVK